MPDYNSYGPLAALRAAQDGQSTLGIANPPGVDAALSRLGIKPQMDASTAYANSTLFRQQQAQQRRPRNPIDASQAGTFVDLDRRPFALTCQRWLDASSTVDEQAQYVEKLRKAAKAAKGKPNESQLVKEYNGARERHEKARNSGDARPPSRRFIYCRVNPAQITWNMALRVADQRTLAGTVQHAWRQTQGVRRRTYFSEPVLGVTFQSGNIMPVVQSTRAPEVSIATGAAGLLGNLAGTERPEEFSVRMPVGLQNFYDFMDLVNESRIVDDGASDRRANVVYLMYTSRLYPSMVLAGLFTPEGIALTENAQDPNQVQWTCSFTVYDSFPRFDRGDELVRSWLNSGFGTLPAAPQSANNVSPSTEAAGGRGSIEFTEAEANLP